ncbi:3'5'-cyclic nucleotide phosphodiesterase domain-containing protein, partial [Toxoplasma gondii RUB]
RGVRRLSTAQLGRI